MKNLSLFTFFLLQFTFFEKTAEAQLLWVNAIPTLYHPSFAGSTSQLRISTNTSFQNYNPPSMVKNSQWIAQNNFNADKFIPKIHSGVSAGMQYYNNYNTSEFIGNLIIAPKLSFKGKYTFSPSIQYAFGDYRSKRSDSTKVHTTRNSFLLGLMLNNKNSFIGISYFPFASDILFISGVTLRRSMSSKFSFTPVLFLDINSTLSSIPLYNQVLSLTFRYNKVIFGIDSWSNLMLGYERDRFRLMLIQKYNTYAIRTSFDQGNYYSAQVSLRYMFGQKE